MARLDHAQLGPDPAWADAFWFELPGPARSKSNARRFAHTSGRAAVKERAAYRANKEFGEHVANVARVARPRGWELGPDGRGVLHDRPDVVAVVIARSTLDAPNVPKTLLDAVQGIVYHDDASVRACLPVTVRGRGGGLIGFARLAPGSSTAEHLAAVTALAQAMLEPAGRIVAGVAD